MNQMAELGRAEEFAPKDPIETCVLWLLEGLDKPMSAAALRASVARLPGPWTFEEAIEALESFGLRCRERSVSLSDLLSTHKSSIFLSEGAVVAAIQPKTEAHPAQLFVPTRNLRPTPLSVEALAMIYGGMVIEIEAELKIGTEDDNQKGRFGHWFFGPLLASKFVYFQVMMAALLTNIFALATSGFSMIVYDRVMPNGAMETLVALLVGVFIIIISDFVIRSLRSYFLDVAGAQADMVIADTLFEQVIDMELAARTSPTGSVANSLREFESLRDFLTSATLTTLIDLPFAVLFLFVIWTIGGPLVYVPLAAIPLIIGSTLLIQPSLRKLTQSNYEDGQTKNSVAIETLQGIETIKAIGAGP
jgi:ATP-binding cassette subfamily C protein LapB